MDSPEPRDRRSFLSFAAMAAGLVAGYGTFGWIAGRYLYPAVPKRTQWVFVRPERELRPGDALPFKTPAGATVTLARRGSTGTAADFLALSDTCPHLGCKVSWEAANNRFFCPCHNGAFDAEGRATAGPPADAKQELVRFPVKVDQGLVYMEVPR